MLFLFNLMYTYHGFIDGRMLFHSTFSSLCSRLYFSDISVTRIAIIFSTIFLRQLRRVTSLKALGIPYPDCPGLCIITVGACCQQVGWYPLVRSLANRLLNWLVAAKYSCWRWWKECLSGSWELCGAEVNIGWIICRGVNITHGMVCLLVSSVKYGAGGGDGNMVEWTSPALCFKRCSFYVAEWQARSSLGYLGFAVMQGSQYPSAWCIW